jgi:Zn-dependent protease
MNAETIEQLRWGALSLILLVISIGLHEFGHAWVADLRGDLLPRSQGRVTLNPLAHADPLGTLLLPGIMIFLPILLGRPLPFGLLGWGKPVQISLANPRTRRMDDILITLAGPAMNVALVVIFALIAVLGDVSVAGPGNHDFAKFLVRGIFMNAGLAAFNLLPLPPLDGSRVFYRLGIYSTEVFLFLSRWSFFILLIFINTTVFSDVVWWLMTPVVDLAASIWPAIEVAVRLAFS